MQFVLDASALVAVFKREAGHGKVKAAVPASAISVVNLSEVAEHIVRLGGSRAEVVAGLRPFPFQIIDADENLALEAALLSKQTRHLGLSLGDRFCLALAKRMGRPALTGDRRWAAIADQIGTKVELFR